MQIKKIIWILLLFPSLCFATPTWLLCPYVTVIEGNDSFRDVSIRDIRYTICNERGFGACGAVGQKPYAVQEVDGNQGLVFGDITGQQLAQALGLGCTVTPRATLDVDTARPRNGRLIVKDRPDGIAPVPDGVLALLQARVPQRQSYLEKTWKKVVKWISPTSVKALGSFPDVTLLDNFNRSENPLISPWFLFDTDLNAVGIDTNVVRCTTTACNMYYNVTTPASAHAIVTLTQTGLSGIGLRGGNIGATPQGYQVRYTTNVNEMRIYRLDAGVYTQLSFAAQAETNGDLFGISTVGTTIESWVNTGAGWTMLDTTTDATYGSAGFPWFWMNSTSARLDDFSATLSSGQGTSLGFYLLKR